MGMVSAALEPLPCILLDPRPCQCIWVGVRDSKGSCWLAPLVMERRTLGTLLTSGYKDNVSGATNERFAAYIMP